MGSNGGGGARGEGGGVEVVKGVDFSVMSRVSSGRVAICTHYYRDSECTINI